MNPNQSLVDQLKKIGFFYEGKGEPYRSRSFLNASDTISKLPQRLENIKDLKGLPGIGPGITERIKEFMETGGNKEINQRDSQEIVEELTTSYGIGRQTAHKLVDQGIEGLNDLIRKYNRGDIKLTSNQIIGLAYYKDFKQRIPRQEVERIGQVIYQSIKEEQLLYEIVGSYRRKKETSGDIDILVSHPTHNPLTSIIEKLREIGLILHTFSLGQVKFQGIYNSGFGTEEKGIMRKLDIRYVPYSSWIPALLHATGSDIFNRNIRVKVLEKGMTLSEHGLYRTNSTGEKVQEIPLHTEEELFVILGLDYIPPEKR